MPYGKTNASLMAGAEALLLGLTFGQNPGLFPTDHPVCAIYGDITLSAKNCGFSNFKECQASVDGKGRGGHCEINRDYLPRAKSKQRGNQ